MGGFALTYLAWDRRLKVKVATKEYLPRELATRARDGRTVVPHSDREQPLFDNGREKFLAEGALLAKCRHRNVVRITDLFETNGTAYLVMDYLDGETIEDRLSQERAGRLSEQTALGLTSGILDGLEAVHLQGILHRDLKPANIYLEHEKDTGQEVPLLLDFGAAREAIGRESGSLTVIYTEGYAPPEQYRRTADQQEYSDLYAASATLYCMLTGAPPTGAMARVMEGAKVVPPAAFGVSQHVSDTLMVGLAMDPIARPQSVEAFRNMLFQQVPPSTATGCPPASPLLDPVPSDEAFPPQLPPATAALKRHHSTSGPADRAVANPITRLLGRLASALFRHPRTLAALLAALPLCLLTLPALVAALPLRLLTIALPVARLLVYPMELTLLLYASVGCLLVSLVPVVRRWCGYALPSFFASMVLSTLFTGWLAVLLMEGARAWLLLLPGIAMLATIYLSIAVTYQSAASSLAVCILGLLVLSGAGSTLVSHAPLLYGAWVGALMGVLLASAPFRRLNLRLASLPRHLKLIPSILSILGMVSLLLLALLEMPSSSRSEIALTLFALHCILIGNLLVAFALSPAWRQSF